MLLTLGALPGVSAQSWPVPPAPDPPRLVNDRAGLLSPAERDALERKLVAYDDSTSTQIAVVILPSLEGAPAIELATAIGRAWGVGRAGRDNGVVLLVGVGDRELAIATGRGAEGGLTDATAGRIIRRVLAPRFREGQFYAGLDEATDAIMAALAGEFEAEAASGAGLTTGDVALCLILVVILVFVAIAVSQSGGGAGGRPPGGVHTVPRSRPRARRGGPGVIVVPGGGWGGGWGGGGFGGGGFGGFGGGSFGGGGASGGW